VHKLIALAALGLVVAATTVAASPARTTESELDIVRSLGIEYGQGYFWGRPA